MLKKLKNRKEEGFTIIEVLIVLAIAGLILLVVFLAVPALQRNSRNTQRKGDVQAVLGGVTEFMSNNAGKLPTGYAANQVTGAAGTTPAGAKVGYYPDTAGTVTIQAYVAGASLSADRLAVYTGAKCGATAGTIAPGSARQVAALYRIEGSGGEVTTCTDS